MAGVAGIPQNDFFSQQPRPGHVATSTQYPGGGIFGPRTNVDWVMQAAEIMAGNIMKNWKAAGGQPEGWNEAKYGSWAAIVQRNAGKEEFAAFDFKTLVNWLMNDYQPRSGDWFHIHVGQYIPPSQFDWMVPVDDQIKLMEQQRKTQEAELERQMRLHQLQVELMQANRSTGSRSSTSSVRYSSGGGGGSAAPAPMDEYQKAKLELDWFIAQHQAKMDQESLSLQRLKLELDEAYRRDQLAYQRERDRMELQTQRGLAAVQTMANPNDALHREFMLRHFNNLPLGQEPMGTAVDVFSGQALNNGQPSSWSQIQEQNAQNWGTTSITPGVPPVTAPWPSTPPPSVPPPPTFAPQTPSFAHGTRMKKKRSQRKNALSSYAIGTEEAQEFGHTREKFFLVGDSADGRPTGNEELIINHDAGRVTVIPHRYVTQALSAIANRRVRNAT